MKIKPSSRSCLVPRGSLDSPRDEQKWPVLSEFPALGHILQDNGDVRACWTQTKRSMWRAFFGNCGARAAGHLDLSTRCKLLQRSVAPCLNYRNTRWPPHQQLCREVDQLQRKMLASLMRIPMLPGERPEIFARRRNRTVSARCKENGLWSIDHCRRVTEWRDHILRPANANSWAAMLYEYRGSQWPMKRRAHNAEHICKML